MTSDERHFRPRHQADALADHCWAAGAASADLRTRWRQRTALLAVVAGMLLLAVYSFCRLDFSLVRLLSGLHHLGDFVVLMFPPSAEGRFRSLSAQALGETVAIAFLGTLVAATAGVSRWRFSPRRT